MMRRYVRIIKYSETYLVSFTARVWYSFYKLLLVKWITICPFVLATNEIKKGEMRNGLEAFDASHSFTE